MARRLRHMDAAWLCLAILQLLVIVHLYQESATRSSRIRYLQNSDFVSRSAASDTRPHFVMGILSSNDKRAMRDSQRDTWLSHAQHANIPFRFTYKFLLDEPTKATEAENRITNDIIYLNLTTHGRAVKFGEKNYKWFKYIHEHYPDALLGARVDDDTYICVPQMFERIASLQSHKLFYGWGYPPKKGEKVRRIDEMFILLGDELMTRIAKRTYCSGSACDPNKDIIDKNWGGLSIQTWLSIYEDVESHTDNKHILHFDRNQNYKAYADKYVKENFCDKLFLYHKSSIEINRKLHGFQMKSRSTSNVNIDNENEGSVTGNLFSGGIVRDVPLIDDIETVDIRNDDMTSCNYWAVVTTIFKPSEAVIRVANTPEWCLVIVGDARTPDKDVFMGSISGKQVTFLTLTDQHLLYPELSKSIPLNHFGRKNIGYMYAIHHGAKYIWDFDDDNVGIVDLSDFTDKTKLFATACKGFNEVKLNPYPYFGVKDIYTWPRGFPLQHIKNNNTVPKVCDIEDPIKIGVVQSLANIQPDVDAIYRLTREMPFNFTAKKGTAPFVIPNGIYSPFNAQATMWQQPAFALLPLPVSVNSRVGDIWRSYIAQFFMHRNGIRLIFSIPYVNQQRNEHMNIKDFNAENDLYEKSDQLVDFLSSSEASQIKTLEELYASLYTRKYLEQDDLNFIMAWTKTYDAIKNK